MARRPQKSAPANDLIGQISDTISRHPRVSAAAAFQMGVLLGQAMNNRGETMKAVKRTMASAPGFIASSIPTFGLFESKPARAKSARKSSARKTTGGRKSGKKGTAQRAMRG